MCGKCLHKEVCKYAPGMANAIKTMEVPKPLKGVIALDIRCLKYRDEADVWIRSMGADV